MSEAVAPYPDSAPARARWTVANRAAKNRLDPDRPYAFFAEKERAADGRIVDVSTILLTNRECPFRCVMCDLWKNTLDETVPPGAIPRQIDIALESLPPAAQIKLYNSGSFFDPRAIPPGDDDAIAKRLIGFERVIVESHTAFLNDRARTFQSLLPGQLEVAIGLETASDAALARMNKQMSTRQFSQAAYFLHAHGIALRVFLMLTPPFIPKAEAELWARRSIDLAIEAGATAVTIIPTRIEGAMQRLFEAGLVERSSISLLEAVCEYGIGRGGLRVFADLWDFSRLHSCARCAEIRRARLEQMNLEQRILPSIHCDACG